MDIQDGKYLARCVDQSLYQAPSGAYCLAMLCALVDADDNITTTTLRNTWTLVDKDGTINSKTWERARKCFPEWDGSDFTWLVSDDGNKRDLSTVPLEIEVAHEEYTKQDGSKAVGPKIKWVNPPGSGGSGAMPQGVDLKLFASKFGSKTRALSGGVSVPANKPKPAAAAPAVPAPARKPLPPPISKQVVTVTTSNPDEVWSKLQELNPEMGEGELSDLWQKLSIAKNITEHTTPQQWGTVLQSLTDNVPY